MKRVLFFIASALLAISCHSGYTVRDGQLTVTCENSVVRLQAVSPEMIRVSVTPDGRFSDRKSLVVVPQSGFSGFKVVREGDNVCLVTSAMKAVVSPDGKVGFFDSEGKAIVDEGRFSFDPIEVEGKKAWSVRTFFNSTPDESFYGLGQQQAGEFDHKGLQ